MVKFVKTVIKNNLIHFNPFKNQWSCLTSGRFGFPDDPRRGRIWPTAVSCEHPLFFILFHIKSVAEVDG